MKTRADPVGVVVALALWVAIGVALALPALPPGGFGVTVSSVALDTVGTVLMVSALSVPLLPLGPFSLYRLFSLADR